MVTDINTTILIYNNICTISLCISIYIRYDLWLQWSKTVKMYTQLDTLVNTGIWKLTVLEIMVCIIAPMPFLDGIKYYEYVEAFETTISYEVNDILLFFCFNRLYLCVKYLLYLTQFMSPRA